MLKRNIPGTQFLQVLEVVFVEGALVELFEIQQKYFAEITHK